MMQYPIIKNKDKFRLAKLSKITRIDGSCIGGGCISKYNPRDMGWNESFECTEVNDCHVCILAIDDCVDISIAVEWLISEGCITKEKALEYNLGSLSKT